MVSLKPDTASRLILACVAVAITAVLASVVFVVYYVHKESTTTQHTEQVAETTIKDLLSGKTTTAERAAQTSKEVKATDVLIKEVEANFDGQIEASVQRAVKEVEVYFTKATHLKK
jgi:hypothetical protein